MVKSHAKMSLAEWALRIGVFGTFFGHGIFALMQKPGWIEYFTAVGINDETAMTLMLVIGVMDIAVAVLALFRPVRIVLLWAALWGLITAMIRPIAGEPIWDFVERWSNWAAPLALLFLYGWPKATAGWMRVTDKK